MNFNIYLRTSYYNPSYFCGILPEIRELRQEFKIGSSTIENKVREKGTVKGPHIHARPSTERKMQNYRW